MYSLTLNSFRLASSTLLKEHLPRLYRQVRSFSTQLAAPLGPEDQTIQGAWFVSPTKWHLAYVTWFFETFVLMSGKEGYKPFKSDFQHLFNSYYKTVGSAFPQAQRGQLSRPTVQEVMAYRAYVDEQMQQWFQEVSPESELLNVVVLGLQHEQQHQELLITDIKYTFSLNPLFPAYHEASTSSETTAPAMTWVSFEEGISRIGVEDQHFHYDNEGPAHRVFLEPFSLSSRLVTNAEYIDFLEDGAYQTPELWLDAGWSVVNNEGWQAPLYWFKRDDEGLRWTATQESGPRLFLFLGSNIGHFEPEAAQDFLHSIREGMSSEDRLLLGFDRNQDAVSLEAAYDDSAGVTEDFIKNILLRINRELQGSFDADSFVYSARFNPKNSRVDMHLESTRQQEVDVLNQRLSFEQGEKMHIESSHKYPLQELFALAENAGFHSTKRWMDSQERFVLSLFEAV